MTDSDSENPREKLPATPTLSRKLFERDAQDCTEFPSTAEEKQCENDKFHTIVARLLHQVLPSATLEDIDTLLRTYFNSHGIENEDGLSALSEGDFPPITSVDSTSLWKKIIFRKGLSTICLGCVAYKLLPTTPYSLLQKSMIAPQSFSKPPTTPIQSPTQQSRYKIDSCSKVELKPYSGLTAEYKAWNEHVEYSYGVAGLNKFLTDVNLCSTHIEISHSIKFNLCKALQDGTLSFLIEREKGGDNAAEFYKFIKDEADEAADHRVREFQAWWHLFTHSFTTRDEYTSFVNSYNTSIACLKESKSVGVGDDVLLRALIIRAIQCDDLDDVKKIINKDLTMKPSTIFVELRSHHLALASEEQMNDSTPPNKSVTFNKTKSIRRGGRGDKDKEKKEGNSNSSKESSKYRVPFVPSWPKGLYDVCSNSLWKQLSDWKALVNKLNKKGHEKKLLDDFKITSSSTASRPDTKRKHSDYSKKDSYSKGYQKDDHRKRGSYSKRHSDDRKRYTRRRTHDSSPDRSESSSDRSASSERSHKRSRRSRCDKSLSPERDRSAARVMGGILQRR